jgi:LytS/YehU family sensor histidine kinase
VKARTTRIWATLAVFGGFIVDMAYGHALNLGPIRADLGFVCLMVAGIFVGASTGAVLGLALGILQASYGSVYAGSVMVSRTSVGWGVGVLEEHLFRDSAYVAVALTFAGTLFCELTFYACAPQADVRAFAIASLRTACGNGLLALPVYLALRRVMARNTDEVDYSR